MSQIPAQLAHVSAAEHLSDAKLHLLRATLALKAAAQVQPSLVVKLGTPHSQLQDVLSDLERIHAA